MIEIKNSFISRVKEKGKQISPKEVEFGAIISHQEKNHSKKANWLKSRPVIDEKICAKCGICVAYCPESAIEIKKIAENKKIIVNYNYCKGCGICAENCPQKAIKMK